MTKKFVKTETAEAVEQVIPAVEHEEPIDLKAVFDAFGISAPEYSWQRQLTALVIGTAVTAGLCTLGVFVISAVVSLVIPISTVLAMFLYYFSSFLLILGALYAGSKVAGWYLDGTVASKIEQGCTAAKNKVTSWFGAAKEKATGFVH